MGGVAGVVRFAAAARPADFAALAPRLTSSADAAAVVVMKAATAQVRAAVDVLQPAGALLPVVFLGGLGPLYAARLAGRWPRAEPLGDGLAGALWLALQDASFPQQPSRAGGRG
jgi:glucosamine kinase